MKSVKLILSVVLSMSIIMTSFSAFAYNDIPAEDIIDYIFRFDVGNFVGGEGDTDENDPDVEIIKFLDLAGLWDDTSISKDKLISMTEFAVIMSKVKLGSDNALMEVYKQNPDSNNVSYKTAIECLLYATGYNNKYKEYGDGDNAFIIVASEIGLIPEKIENVNAFITRGELANLIMKAITVDLCVMEYLPDGYGYSVVEGKNLLNSVHNIYDVSGFVNAVPGLSVYGGASLREGYIEINRANINASGQDFTKYFGKYVIAYAKLDETFNEYKVLFVQEDKESKYIEIDFSKITSINENVLTFVDEENNEHELSVQNLKTVVENGKKIDSVSSIRDYYSNTEGKIVFTSSEKYGSFDTAIIYKYNYFVVDYVDTSLARIGLKNGQTYKGEKYIQLDEHGINSVSIYGVKANYSDIPLNSSIRVLECSETKYFHIDASSERQKGEVALVYDDMVETAGKRYRMSKDILNHIKYCEENNITGSDRAVNPQLGNTYTFYIIDSVIVGLSVTDDPFTYGIVKSASEARTSIDPEITIRVFTEDGEWKNFGFTDKIELEGKSGASKSDVATFIKENSSEVIGGLIRYKANADGKIKSLYTSVTTGVEADPDDVNLVESITVEVDWTKWYIKGSSSNYLFDPNAKVFVVPTNKTKEADYKVLNPSAFENGMVYTISLYNPDDFLQVGAVVYNGNLSDAAAESNTPTFLYVENIRRVLLDKEDLIFGYKVSGMEGIRGGGKGTGIFEERSYYVTEDDYNRKMAAGEEFRVGDFLKIDVLGTKLTNWDIGMRDGKPNLESGNFNVIGDEKTVITEQPTGYYMIDYDTKTVNSYELMYGKIKRINYEEFLILVDFGDYGLRTVGTRILGSVNKDTHKLENLSISNFHTGEEVQIITGGPNAYMTLKYVN